MRIRNLAQLTKYQRDQAFKQATQDANKGVIISTPAPGGSGSVSDPSKKVLSINSLQGAVTIAEGANIDITVAGQTITIESTASGGGSASGTFDFGSITEASTYDWDWGTLA